MGDKRISMELYKDILFEKIDLLLSDDYYSFDFDNFEYHKIAPPKYNDWCIKQLKKILKIYRKELKRNNK